MSDQPRPHETPIDRGDRVHACCGVARFTSSLALVAFLVLSGCGGTRDVVEEPRTGVPTDSAATPDVARGEASQAEMRDAALPLDAAVRFGTLANGLTWYVRQNERPDARAELRLVIDAGSILEDDDQRGLAHVVEHMAFNGTERFEKQELVDYLELTGVRFGADLNASTSFDETTYELQVPTDSIQIFDTGVDILREWASRVTFEPDEIEAERGVVMEEWRLGRGAAARIQDQQLPVLLHGSRYPDRLPIGNPESLAGFDHEALTRYYHDWYRPDLAAVIIVGDIDPDYAEQRLKAAFSSWEPANAARERPSFDVPDHDRTLVKTITDDEAPFSSIAVVYKHPGEPLQTEGQYRRWLVEQLVHRMLNDRLDELTQTESPPFFGAGSGKGSFARSREFYTLSAIAVGDRTIDALRAMLLEGERFERHGFTDTEIERAKAELLRAFESSYNERDKEESGSYVNEYVAHFLEHTASPGIEFEFALVQRVLPTVTADEINGVARGLFDTRSRVVLVDGPTGSTMPSESDVLAVFDEVEQAEIAAYDDQGGGAELLADPPEPGAVVASTTDELIGVTRWTMSNGARVVLKPTDFKNDEILFAAYSPGGSSLVPDELDVHADFASTIIGQGGVASFGPVELQKMLSGLRVQVQPTISERSEGFAGQSSPEDIETLLQLVFLYATQSRADTTMYRSLKERYGSVIESLKSDPSRAFTDTLAVTLARHHPRRKVMSRELLEALDLGAAHEIFVDRFADVSDFTFYFVGAFGSPDSLRSLVETYIGGLPGAGRMEEPRDLGIRPPTGHVERVVTKGQEPQSRVQLVFTGPAEWTQRNRRMSSLIEGVLDIRLRELLREELGGTYGASVSASLMRDPVEQFSFAVGFGCQPDRVDELTQAVLSELARFRESGAHADEVVKVRETSANALEVGLKQNGFWLSSLMFYDRNDLDATAIPGGASEFFETVTNEEIVDAAQVFLNPQNMVRVVLLPEGGVVDD